MMLPIISSGKHFHAPAFAFLCHDSQHCPTRCTQKRGLSCSSKNDGSQKIKDKSPYTKLFGPDWLND